jgi:hypothetical protein
MVNKAINEKEDQMRNRFIKTGMVTSVVAALFIFLVGSVSAAGPAAIRGFNGSGSTTSGIRTVVLTADELESLTFMREEEKLARDVYLYLFEKWQWDAFSNIAVSEQRHMDAINNLLVRYGIPDPVSGNTYGVFTNPELQVLYDKLIEQGSKSIEGALQVGVLIETTDIVDLQEGLADTTHKDINNVYSNLLKGSNNHLRAFNNELVMVK